VLSSAVYAAQSPLDLSQIENKNLLLSSQLIENTANSATIVPRVSMIGGQYQFDLNFVNDTKVEAWAFVPFNSVFENVTVSLYQQDVLVQQLKTGSTEKLEFPYHYGVHLALNTQQTYRMNVQFDSPYFSSLPEFKLVPQSDFSQQVVNENLVILFCLGAILLLVAYNFLIGLNLRDASFIYYSLYMLANFMGWSGVFNVFAQHFNVTNFDFHNVSFFFNVIFSLLFSIKFLSLKTMHPKLAKIMMVIVIIAGLMVVTQWWLPNYTFMITTFMVGFCLNFAIYAGVRRWMQGFSPAKYFVLGYALIYLAGFVILPGNLGFPDFMDNSELFTLLCITGDAILLALALADRIRLISKQSALAQKARITAEKNLREEEVRSTARLHEANEMLEDALQVSRSANEQKDQFIMAASHELRTPLQSVMGILDQLDLEHEAERRAHLKDDMIKGTARLSEQIEHLVTMAELGQGKLQRLDQGFSLQDLTRRLNRDIHRAHQIYGQAVNLTFAKDLPDAYEGDLNLTSRLLAPVIENACKFNMGGNDIKVDVNTQENGLIIDIVDQGPGLSSVAQSRLFQAFEQGEGSDFNREYEGLGLGLAISSQIAEILSASVTFETKINVGTKFEVRLPIKLDYRQQEKKVVVGHRPQTILIVEDNPVNAGVLKAFLSKLGFQHYWVANGKLATEFMQDQGCAIDLVLMDLQMPIMDGFEASEHIKKILPEMPIIAVSANSEYESRKRCNDIGIDGFLAKPIGLQDVKLLLSDWFEAH
jgi:two-component system, sensor histidine kinase LadS